MTAQPAARPPYVPSRVDFGYTFATPHRLTVALPDSSDKTLLDLYPDYLRMAWSYEDLRDKPPAALMIPTTRWEVHFRAEIDGRPFSRHTWGRVEGWIPALDEVFAGDCGSVHLEMAAAEAGLVARVSVRNADYNPHAFLLHGRVPGNWAGQLPAQVNPAWDRDHLLAGWLDRADRVLLLTIGGDDKPIAPNTVSLHWQIEPHGERTAWIVRPFRAYSADMPALRARDWASEFEAGLAAWRELIGRSARIEIPDPGVQRAYYAGLADLFVMREPVSDGTVAMCPGTEAYRAANPYEAGTGAVAIDQAGLHRESADGFRMPLAQQGADGDWNDPQGWAHTMWGTAGFKSWVVMEHFRLTGDTGYLAGVFPRMLAAARFNEHMRATTRVMPDGERPVTYGLMPPGMGDGGLWDGDSMFGVFFPHNILAVYADRCALEAAEILGRPAEAEELSRIFETGLSDLLLALERGAITEPEPADGGAAYRWIPGCPGKTGGSRWEVLPAAYPLRLLPLDHPLIEGTIRKMESRLSPGGLPLHLGWQKDGLWVAIALDNLAELLLARGEGDRAISYLYAALNHGTPLYTWCEERGMAAGSADCTGDRQHLWTPVAGVRLLRDCLVMEDAEAGRQALHLCRGAHRSWLVNGPLAVAGASSYFGDVSFRLAHDRAAGQVTGFVELSGSAPELRLHVRLPEGVRLKAAPAAAGGGGSSPDIDGECLVWRNFSGRAEFTVPVVAGAAPASARRAAPALTVYPAPAGEPLSADFTVTVNGVAVPVYPCRVSAAPVNQVWPGYQRPLDQSEMASFAYFDVAGPATVEVVSARPVAGVVVRPLSYGIRPAIDGNRITFTLDGPRQVAVEVNGWHGALHLFANPPETDAPAAGDPGVIYFGPGIHRPGPIRLDSGQTAYIAGGAVVYGAIKAENAHDVRILGRGILDASALGRFDAGPQIELQHCRNVTIAGIILRDPHQWTVMPARCQDVAISNIKIVGLWRYNADGIDVVNSQRVTVEDCFVRSFDDSLVVKGLNEPGFDYSTPGLPVQDVVFRRCVVWNDWGRGLEIGAETAAPVMEDIVFEDCDVIHYVHRALDIQHGDRAVVRRVRFENIRVEEPIVEGAAIAGQLHDPSEVGLLIEMIVNKTMWSHDRELGRIEDVTFRNVSAEAGRFPRSNFQGYDAEHGITGVTIANLRIGGRPITGPAAGQVAINAFVRDVRWIE